MTQRLSEVSAHLHAVRQVGAVVNAMRALAGARAQQGQALLPAVRAYAEVAVRAIAQALLLEPDESGAPEPRRGGGLTLLVFGAEQGFAGGFADLVLDTIPEGAPHILLCGSRTATLASERGRRLDAELAMPARAQAVAGFSAELVDRLFEHLRRTGSQAVEMIVPVWTGAAGVRVDRRALTPLDPHAFAPEHRAEPPLTNLPASVLLDRLGEEYVFARICEAAMDAYVAENQARVTAMASARRKIDEQLNRLQRLEHRVRQEQITAEVIELARRPRRS